MRKDENEITSPNKGSVSRFLTSRDASIGTKNVVGTGILWSLIALAFAKNPALCDQIALQTDKDLCKKIVANWK